MSDVDKTKVSERLTSILTDNNWKVKKTNANVLQAVCKDTVSFSALSRCLESCKAEAKTSSILVEPLISTIGKELIVSVRIGGKRQREEENDGHAERSTENIRDKIRSTMETLSKKDCAPPKTELNRAVAVLDKVVCVLVAAGGAQERATQSYGVFLKKLTPSDPRNRIVLAFRLHAGTPVRLADLKQCLGECWADGALTSADTVNGIDSISLPLTAEGSLSLEHGNSPILLVTSLVPSDTSDAR